MATVRRCPAHDFGTLVRQLIELAATAAECVSAAPFSAGRRGCGPADRQPAIHVGCVPDWPSRVRGEPSGAWERTIGHCGAKLGIPLPSANHHVRQKQRAPTSGQGPAGGRAAGFGGRMVHRLVLVVDHGTAAGIAGIAKRGHGGIRTAEPDPICPRKNLRHFQAGAAHSRTASLTGATTGGATCIAGNGQGSPWAGASRLVWECMGMGWPGA